MLFNLYSGGIFILDNHLNNIFNLNKTYPFTGTPGSTTPSIQPSNSPVYKYTTPVSRHHHSNLLHYKKKTHISVCSWPCFWNLRQTHFHVSPAFTPTILQWSPVSTPYLCILCRLIFCFHYPSLRLQLVKESKIQVYAALLTSSRFVFYNIRRIRPFLSGHATQLLVHALVEWPA